MLRTISLLIAGLLAATGAVAADHGVYLGGAISQSSVDYSGAGSVGRIDGNNTKFKLIGGVRPLNWLAIEANYVDFGSVTAGTGDFKLKGIDAFALGIVEVAIVDFYAKAGLMHWDSTLHVTNINVPNDTSGSDFAYGGGVQAHLGSLNVRAEFEKFAIPNTSNVSLISVGVTWTFL